MLAQLTDSYQHSEVCTYGLCMFHKTTLPFEDTNNLINLIQLVRYVLNAFSFHKLYIMYSNPFCFNSTTDFSII